MLIKHPIYDYLPLCGRVPRPGLHCAAPVCSSSCSWVHLVATICLHLHLVEGICIVWPFVRNLRDMRQWTAESSATSVRVVVLVVFIATQLGRQNGMRDSGRSFVGGGSVFLTYRYLDSEWATSQPNPPLHLSVGGEEQSVKHKRNTWKRIE